MQPGACNRDKENMQSPQKPLQKSSCSDKRAALPSFSVCHEISTRLTTLLHAFDIRRAGKVVACISFIIGIRSARLRRICWL